MKNIVQNNFRMITDYSSQVGATEASQLEWILRTNKENDQELCLGYNQNLLSWRKGIQKATSESGKERKW